MDQGQVVLKQEACQKARCRELRDCGGSGCQFSEQPGEELSRGRRYGVGECWGNDIL